MKFSNILFLSLAVISLAHPGHHEPEHQLIAKRAFNANARRGLAACEDKLVEVKTRAKARRATTLRKNKRSIEFRDTESVLNESHASNSSYNPTTLDETIFETSNTCVVNPEGEAGPYWVKGEHIRYDLQEGQAGIPIILEAQFLDLETCEPLTNVWWDLWNCNATGVYSGLVATGNGNTDDASNINSTFLRGIQKVDDDGVATFKTVFPGHYSGRTTHHHIVVHLNATYQPNGTLTGGSYAHVGQFFWDQDIIDKVESTYPYNTNNVTITKNEEDRVFATETTDTTSDPVFKYTYLGSTLEEGLFGWITVVVNTSATYDPAYSYVLTESGGVAQSGGTESVDGGSPGGGNGTSGGMPSGSMSGGMPSSTPPAMA